jgi:HSP20 family protein
MAITRYDPFRDLLTFSDQLNRAFGQFTPISRRQEELGATGWPAVNIYEDSEGLTLSAELPGVDPKAVDVRLENNTLTVSGERKLDKEETRDNYHRIESWQGTFSRSFSLPPTLDTEKVKAEHKNGLLRVFLPRKETSKPKQIKVSVES